MLGTKGGVGSLPSVDGEWYVWMVKDRKHCWKGESLNFRLEFVPEAVSIGCVDRMMTRAGGMLCVQLKVAVR